MSQEAIERILGRMITDERFRRLAIESLENTSIEEGYRLTPAELLLLSDDLKLQHIAELGDQLRTCP